MEKNQNYTLFMHTKLCIYIDTVGFIACIKKKMFTNILIKMLIKDSILTSYDLDRPLPRKNPRKIMRSMKDKLGRKIIMNIR